MHRLAIAFLLFSLPVAAEPLIGSIDDPSLRRKIDLVYLEDVAGSFPPPAQSPIVNQKGNVYRPHVTAVVAGTRVTFQSQDPELHNIFARAARAVLFNDAVLPGNKTERVFKQLGLVHLTCNIHKEMSAYVMVLQNPYFASIDPKSGSFHIDNVPPAPIRCASGARRSPMSRMPRSSRSPSARRSRPRISLRVSGFAPMGETILIRMMAMGWDHTFAFHPHAYHMQVIGLDGRGLDSPYWKDTLPIASGERIDVLVPVHGKKDGLCLSCRLGKGLSIAHDHNLHGETSAGKYPRGPLVVFAIE
jgi:plastocyanin